jgi:hypothetical protein
MTDILADYFDWRAEQEDRIGTHSDDCHMWPRHERCMIHRLARALEAARLTAEERQAIAWVCGDVADITGPTEDGHAEGTAGADGVRKRRRRKK